MQAEEKCYLCGEGGHRQFECPNQKLDVYQLPDQMKAAAQAQYERDIIRVKGAPPEPELESWLVLVCRIPGLIWTVDCRVPVQCCKVPMQWLYPPHTHSERGIHLTKARRVLPNIHVEYRMYNIKYSDFEYRV